MARVDALPLAGGTDPLHAIEAVLRDLGYVNQAWLSVDGRTVVVTMSRPDGLPMRVEVDTGLASFPPDVRRTAITAAWVEASRRDGPIRPPHAWP